MPKYKVVTDGGTYIVETEGPQDNSSMSEVSGPSGLGDALAKGRIAQEVKNTANRAKEGILGFAEGATGGIPREIIEQSPLDTSLSGALGLASAITNQAVTGKSAGKSGVVIPRGNIQGQIMGAAFGAPSMLAKSASGLVKGEKLLNVLSRGAIAGGIEGALLPTKDNVDLGRRTQNAAFGATLGATINSAIHGISRGARDYKLYKAGAEKIKELEAERLALGNPDSKNAVRLREIEVEKANIQKAVRDSIKQASDASNQRLKEIASGLQDESTATAERMKPELSGKMKEFKKDWGRRWDAMVEASQSTTKASDVIAEIDNVLQELSSKDIPLEGSSVSELKSLRAKMQGMIETTTSTPPKTSGDLIAESLGIAQPSKTTENVIDPIIENKELVNYTRGIRKAMSRASYTGGQVPVDDIAGVTFYKNMSNRLKDSIDGMDELYSEYSEFKDMADYAYKTFKPGKDSVNTAQRILKSIGLGKATTDDISNMEKIMKFTGTDFTKPLKSYGQRLDLERTMTAKNIAGAKSMLESRLTALTNESKSVSLTNKRELFRIKDQIADVKKVMEGLQYIGNAKDFVKFTVARGAEGLIIWAVVNQFLKRR